MSNEIAILNPHHYPPAKLEHAKQRAVVSLLGSHHALASIGADMHANLLWAFAKGLQDGPKPASIITGDAAQAELMARMIGEATQLLETFGVLGLNEQADRLQDILNSVIRNEVCDG